MHSTASLSRSPFLIADLNFLASNAVSSSSLHTTDLASSSMLSQISAYSDALLPASAVSLDILSKSAAKNTDFTSSKGIILPFQPFCSSTVFLVFESFLVTIFGSVSAQIYQPSVSSLARSESTIIQLSAKAWNTRYTSTNG